MAKPSKATIIRQLQQVFNEKQTECDLLLQENVALRKREEVLLQQVTQQGDNLHFVALAALQAKTAHMPDMAKTLMQDLEVYELLQLLGSSSSTPGDEPFTTQRLRAAVTPERVAAMRSTSVEEVAAHLKQLTMRMCMLLTGGPSKAHLFSDSIEAVVNEYGEYGLLLHVVADWVSLHLGTMNLDTLQVQEPPPGYWESVVDTLELEDQQVQTLTTGFNSYQKKSKPIITVLHSTVSSIRNILDADATAGSNEVTHCNPKHNGTQQQQQQPGQWSMEGLQPSSGSGTGTDLVPQPASPSAAKPWQQSGLSQGCLTLMSAEQLEQLMTTLMQLVMKLREMHRTVTWLFLNTLNSRQHALFITGSWPWWSRPLTMCQYIAEQHGHLEFNSQWQPSASRSSGGGGSTTPITAALDASAAAMAEGVCQMHLGWCPAAHVASPPSQQQGLQPQQQQQQQQQQRGN